MNFVKIHRYLRSLPDVDYPGPASGAAITGAEDELRIVFPPDYKLFLNHFGTLSVSSEEIFGIGGPDYLDVIARTNDLRTRKQKLFPLPLLPLRNDGFGNYDCIQLRSGNFYIVQWNHEDGSTTDVSDGFEKWLFQLLDMLILAEGTKP
jgi:cell wall assembly regulator SMI1